MLERDWYISDEMNLHVPQSTEAEIEIMVNARCALHIVSSQHNGPINGAVQDALIASYILTNHWEDGTITMVPRKIADHVYETAEIPKDRIKDMIVRAKKYYPSYIKKNGTFAKEIPGSLFFSILFPSNFCYTRTTENNTNPLYHEVQIEDGIILPDSGPLCKKTVGAKNGSIVHVLWKRSPECALKFLSDLQQCTDRWLPNHGFSLGIADCFASSAVEVAKTLIETRQKVDGVVRGSDSAVRVEKEINSILNSAMAVGPRLAKSSMQKGDRNALNIMRCSGAKGSVINLAQIVAFVGQQNILGERIPRQLSHGTRCLPSFLPGDETPDARGFIEDNYMRGLTPQAAFFHAAAGRDGIISTSLKTADTGYMQKRLARKMEDLKVYIDGTVRDAGGNIVSFLYGDDGMEAKKLAAVKGLAAPSFINPMFLARRLNSDARRNGLVAKGDKPRALLAPEIELLMSFIRFSKIESAVIDLATQNARDSLGSIIDRVLIYDCVIADFCAGVRDAYDGSKAPYGTMAGLLATTAIGEPATQMVLNAFHSTGLGGKDASLGVPRFKELINTTKSKDQKRPGCIIHFDYPMLKQNGATVVQLEKNNRTATGKEKEQNDILIARTKEDSLSFVQGLKAEFEETYVDEFLIDCELQYLPDEVDIETGGNPLDLLTYEEYDESWWVKLSRDLGTTPEETQPQSWVIILKFDVEKLFRRRIELEDIAYAIEEKSNHAMMCVSSPNVVGRIEVYVGLSELKTYVQTKIDLPIGAPTDRDELLNSENIDYYMCREVAMSFIKTTQVSGIQGISKIYPRENTDTREWVMDTDGANYLDVLSMPGVDTTKTEVDDMHAVHEVLGIEAARIFVYNELNRVISFDGTYVNPRHLSLLADVMTAKGSLTAASRDGIDHSVGPNSRVMFEKSVDNAMMASTFGEIDPMDSLASSVMYGKVARAGAGSVVVRKSGTGLPPRSETSTSREIFKKKHAALVARRREKDA